MAVKKNPTSHRNTEQESKVAFRNCNILQNYCRKIISEAIISISFYKSDKSQNACDHVICDYFIGPCCG